MGTRIAFTNILQWNCEGLKPKFATGDIHQLIKETNTNCICLQETKLRPEANFVVKKFKSYLKNQDVAEGQNAHGGVAIFVRKFISSYQVKLQTELQAIAVSVKFRKRITLCSLYLPPGEEVSKVDMQGLLDQLPKPFMVLGDFNAHHPLWFDPRRENGRGKMIAELIDENDVVLLDKNKPTNMWKVDKSFSHVDLSLCSADLLTQFLWDVHDEPLSSDHFPILIKSELQFNKGGSPRWVTKDANWGLYQESTGVYKNPRDFSSVDDMANFFETMVVEAASTAIPKTSGKGGRRSPPWWNAECQTAIRKRKAAFRKYRLVTSRVNFNRFSRARAEAKKIIKKSKKTAWTAFVNSINRKSTSREVWKKINLLNNRVNYDQVTTLKLNPKQIKISNVPVECEHHIKEELMDLGCVQSITRVAVDDRVCSVFVRYEEDSSIDKALQFHGTVVQGYRVNAEVVLPEFNVERSPVVLDDEKEIADCLGRRFSYISGEGSCDPRFKEVKDRREKEKLDFSTREKLGYNSPITMQEMEYAMNLADDSSPGPDEVLYSMLKKLAPEGKTLLLELINLIFKEGKLPKRWKEAYIIPILKDGKVATNPGSYRPIALTSCICKLMQRCVNRRLVWWAESKDLIDKNQNGFRPGRGTVDCLATLATEAHHAYRRGEYLFCVFFDLEKAYDTCWKHLILSQLHKHGLRGELPRYIEDFLTERTFRVKVGQSLSDKFEQKMGVPQGGVLSCTLFNIAINTVVEVIRGFVSYSLYVDDKRISFASKNYDTCVDRIQSVLGKLVRWSVETGFRFSTEKTVWMVFHRTRLIAEPIQFMLDGAILKEVTEKKFLGLWHDRLLRWDRHVVNLKASCNRALNILKIISANSRETDSKTLLGIYKALVRSKLDYGCQVYGTAPKTYLEPLDPVHHKGLRLCLGAYRSSPIPSLYVEACEPSLKCRREMLQMQYYVRTKQFLPNSRPIRLDDTALDIKYSRPSLMPICLGYTVRRLSRDYGIQYPNIALLKESVLGPWELPTPVVCMALAVYKKDETSSLEYRQYFLRHKHAVDVEIYTDGSKSSEGVGAGIAVVSSLRDHVFGRRIHETATIFTAELYAIKIALQTLKTYRGIASVIYSDSRSAIQAIKATSRCKLVREILELLVTLKRVKVEVTFCWLPGHAGIRGNEIADKEAKASIGRALISTQEISVSDVQAHIRKKVLDKWKNWWAGISVEQVKLKEVVPFISGTPVDFGLSRMDAVKLTRLRIGHSRITHSHLYNGEDCPECLECAMPDAQQVMSVKHVLLDCSNFALQRLAYYDFREVTLKTLLTDREYVRRVLQFIKDIGWYSKL